LKPVISALMSAFNVERYIGTTIRSILNQTYDDFELIIVNDGSDDRTGEIIRQYDDSRIRIVDLPQNCGIAAALNEGLLLAKGDYLAKVDGDDCYHPDRFLLQKEYLDQHPDIDVAKTLVEHFSDEDHVLSSDRFNSLRKYTESSNNLAISPADIAQQLYWHNCIVHSSVMYRRQLFSRFQYRAFPMGEDYDLFYRMNRAGVRMGTVEETLTSVRVTDYSTTAKHISKFNSVVADIKEEELRQLLHSAERLYLWGAGSFGRDVKRTMESRGFRVHAFIDSDNEKAGTNIDGICVDVPDSIVRDGHSKVLVCSQPGMRSIVRALEASGFEHLKDYMVFR